MIVSFFSVLLLAQLPPPSCAHGEKTTRVDRPGRVELTCSLKGKKLRRVVSEQGRRQVDDLVAGTFEEFLESSGQRLTRRHEWRLLVKEQDQDWWPDGCLLKASSMALGEVFSAPCARARSEAPDGGVGDRVVVIPPAVASMLNVERLSDVGLLTSRTPDGGVRVCVSDGGPCEVTTGQAMVLSGEQAMLLVSMASGQVMLIDRTRRTVVPLADGLGVALGGTEFSTQDGGTVELLSGARGTSACSQPRRRLDDGSLLCLERDPPRGYRRVWKDRTRFCPDESLGNSLIGTPAEGVGPSVTRLQRDADPQCLEVFAGLLDWVR